MMEKINPRYKYPMFFAGLTILICAGFIYKFENSMAASAIIAAAGFIIFILSILL